VSRGAGSSSFAPSRGQGWEDAIALVQANVTLRSAAFRHALRLAACLAAADLIARGLQLPWPYWVPLTVAVVLRPEFGSTFSRGLGRIAGTFVGLRLATALVWVPIGGSFTPIGSLACWSSARARLGPANPGLGAVLLSALVVLLLSLAGDPPQATIVARGLDSSLGAALTLEAALYHAPPAIGHDTHSVRRLAEVVDATPRVLVEVLHGDSHPDRYRWPARPSGRRVAARAASAT
jgi:uncharacterized membrane protein YccC